MRERARDTLVNVVRIIARERAQQSETRKEKRNTLADLTLIRRALLGLLEPSLACRVFVCVVSFKFRAEVWTFGTVSDRLAYRGLWRSLLN